VAGMDELNSALQSKNERYIKLMFEARTIEWAAGAMNKELEKYPESKEFLNNLRKRVGEKLEELERYGKIENVFED